MSLSVKVLSCDGHCLSCYENRIRSNMANFHYDIDGILRTLESEIKKDKTKSTPTLHGGEPLTIKIEDLEKILSLIFSEYGRTSIQTNGVSMTDAHIDLFVKYKTSVGFSLDGDTPELNFGRWNDGVCSYSEIKENTERVLKNIELCKRAGLSLSVISVLRKYNASLQRLPEFVKFLKRLNDEFGIVWVRTNEGIVYDEKQRPHEELSPQEMSVAYVTLASICFSDRNLMWSPYRDVVDALLGSKNVVCVLNECDIWRTQAEEPIDAYGNLGNCLKGGGSIDGYQVLRANEYGRERYQALSQIPLALGGCGGCRWWTICKGGCPGAGLDNDWRAKTRFCEAWARLFLFTENYLKGIFPNILMCYESGGGIKDSLVNLLDGSTYRKDCIKVQAKQIDEKISSGYTDRHGDSPHGDHTDFGSRK